MPVEINGKRCSLEMCHETGVGQAAVCRWVPKLSSSDLLEKEGRCTPHVGLKRDIVVLDARDKKCWRCEGKVFLEHDKYGAYMSCLQCGAIF